MTNIGSGRAMDWWSRAMLVWLGAVCAVACGSLTQREATRALAKALDETVGQDGIRSAAMWVDAPRKGLNRGFASGTANVATNAPMTTATPFLSASVGKLFVAVAILSLHRQGKLTLQDPITRWIPRQALAGLPFGGGVQAASQVTVEMLLTHRSGLPDYFSDASTDGAPRLFDLIAQQPDRTWTRQQMLDYAGAHYAAVGKPGEGFHYSDTNYDLLGLVLEAVAGEPFPLAVRQLVLQPLGLEHTWYYNLEPAPANTPPLADVWIGEVNMQGRAALSADQAGGGLATTASDLRDFLRELSKGNPVPLLEDQPRFTENAMVDGIDVGRAVWRIRPGGIFFLLGGLPTLVGHSGATGVWAYYDAASDAVYTGAVNQSAWQEEHVRFLLSEVVPTVERIE